MLSSTLYRIHLFAKNPNITLQLLLSTVETARHIWRLMVQSPGTWEREEEVRICQSEAWWSNHCPARAVAPLVDTWGREEVRVVCTRLVAGRCPGPNNEICATRLLLGLTISPSLQPMINPSEQPIRLSPGTPQDSPLDSVFQAFSFIFYPVNTRIHLVHGGSSWREI